MHEYVEQKEALSQFDGTSGELEYKIRTKVYCDIIDAVLYSRKEGLLPTGWAVQVSLDLQVDEASAFNPGATFITSPTFSVGAGGVISSQSTREDKFGSYWDLDKLRRRSGSPCRADGESPTGSSLLLTSQLGISEWLADSLRTRFFLPSSAGEKGDPFFKQDVLSYHIKFQVISSGGVNPAWKLVRIATGNGGLPLVSAGRTRTHDLLLTFGPTFKAGAPNLAMTSHAAQEFGIAVSNSGRITNRPFVPQ
jgi:hypothetical protein